MKDDRPQKADNVASVLKVFAVLEALAEERQASLADVAQRAMTSKSTAHRLLQTMIDLGYVDQSETEKYGLTLKLFSLAARSLSGHADLLRVADRVMGTLSRATGESVNLGIMDEREQCVAYIHHYSSAFNLSMQSPLGQRNPLHSTSLGKALLAWRNEDEIQERIRKMDMQKVGPNTITERDALLEQLRRFRELGYAEEIEESEAGVRCMAVPILDHMNRPIAAISISFPLFRFDVERKPEYVSLLTAAGLEASRGLGYWG